MDYFTYKRIFDDRVLVYIEEFNKQKETVLFDFIDSKEFNVFNNWINLTYKDINPSMVLLTNYKGKNIQDNTIYSIKKKTIQSWSNQMVNNIDIRNSFLIGFNIDMKKVEGAFFNEPVSLKKYYDLDSSYSNTLNNKDYSKIPFFKTGRVSVTVRKVGQGNWNEVSTSEKVKIVFDAGASMYASRREIATLIGDRNSLYSISKPILILSHWDKDHYHSLIGMTNTELKNNFSAFVCRYPAPNETSRVLFGRISNAVGLGNTFSIPANPRVSTGTRGGPTSFSPITPSEEKIVLYNSQEHKNRNISGIALTVKTSKGSIILSGDAHYDQISRDILPHLNFRHKHHLIVPHHGGKAGKYEYNIPHLVSLDQAIISVGENHYGHPLEKYINSLMASGFKTKKTNTATSDIKISF